MLFLQHSAHRNYQAVVCLLLLWSHVLWAAIEPLQFDNDAQRERYQALVDELRCPKCQNQNLADSNSPIAGDLRHEVFRMIHDGRSDQEIIDFMVQRYGDFVMYRPPLQSNTLLLWLGPLLFLVIGLVVLVMVRRSRHGLSATDDTLTPEQQALLDELHHHGRDPTA